MATSKPLEVSLTLERRWTIYAFPVGCVPTDERGIGLGADELGQLVEMQTAGLQGLLADCKGLIERQETELVALREANAERLHALMEKK